MIRERDFDAGSDAKTLLYMDMLAFLSSAEQETYIYHVGNGTLRSFSRWDFNFLLALS